jgi:glutamine synthetase
MNQLTNTSTVLRQVQEAGVRQVRFLYCDNAGIIRGKAAGRHALAGCLSSGIGLMTAMQAMNSLDQLQPVEGLGPVGEVRLLPDPRTFRILPYVPHTAALFCDMLTLDGTPWEVCPRTFLRRQVARAHTESGINIIAAFEPEWTLARRSMDGAYTAIDDSLGYSTIGMTPPAAVIDEIITALESQNLRVEQYYSEMGHGQQEITISHVPALEAADNQLVYRETVRSVAWNHSMIASFAPKPFATQVGNGCHIHLSAWAGDRDSNLFYDPADRYQLSQLGYYFIGGVLTHLPALVALTCPSVNSYRRFKPRSWASAYTCYGPDNREAAVRIASPQRGKENTSINLELRAADSTSNPYLALGGIIAAGLDGIRQTLQPGEALLIDPDSLTQTERIERGIRPLPESLGDALDELEKDQVLLDALGPLLAQTYLAVKRSEVLAFFRQDESFEINQHFFKY